MPPTIFGRPFPSMYRPQQRAYTTVPAPEAVFPNTGRTAGGITVTITGKNLLPADGSVPTVTIGGVAATNVSVVASGASAPRDYYITCTVPTTADPGAVDIVVTCGSQSGTLEDAFTYIESVITRVVLPYGPLAGGTEVILEGYNFLEGSLVLFDGTPATEIAFIDSEHISCVTPPHAVGFVDVQIIEPTT